MINGIKLIEVHVIFGLQPYTSKYLKGIIAVVAGVLVTYPVRSWLFQTGYGPSWIIALGGTLFLLTAGAGLWLLGLDDDDKLALLALRRRRQPSD